MASLPQLVTGEQGSVGRPRNSDLDELILEAVRELLVECGYHALSVQEVKRRCNVNIQTITRRWPTKAELVAAAIMGGDFPEDTLPQATGRLRHDLRAVIEAVLRYLNEPATRAAMPALMAEMQTNEPVAARFHRRQEDFRTALDSLLESAIETGDAPQHVLLAGSLLPVLITGITFSVQFMNPVPPKKPPIDELADLVQAAILGGSPARDMSRTFHQTPSPRAASKLRKPSSR
jgi:AcrR family transcriptional regulator